MSIEHEFYVFNSLTLERERFRPIDLGKVKVYSCGPTIYDYAHIGNYRSFLFSDLLHRVLSFLGYEVTLVMNLTDIDDKTIRGAIREKKTLSEFTEVYARAFFEDLKILKVRPATHYPRATEHIKDMVALIKELMHRGYAYEMNGSVYFKIGAFKDYGKLSKIKIEAQQAGASGRVDSDEYEKENVTDFVLWKNYHTEDGEVYYETELGKGRPGWHIECSAMSKHYLGEHFDIHTGGVDNRFPHHENEIAQSECAHGTTYVNYWLHASHLLVEGEKMSKSAGNFYTLRDLLKKNLSPRTIRYMLLSVHYRGQYNFTEAGVAAVDKALERIDNFLATLTRLAKHQALSVPMVEVFTGIVDNTNTHSEQHKQYETLHKKRDNFIVALCDDLNVSGALGALFEYITEGNKMLTPLEVSLNSKTPPPSEAIALIKTMGGFLKEVDDCLGVIPIKEIIESGVGNIADENIEKDSAETDSIESLLENLLVQRNVARKAKNFSEADRLRDEIASHGYVIVDTPSGSVLDKKR